MDQGLAGCPRKEGADDVCVDDIRKGVAPLQEHADVIPQGLVGLLLAALEVPEVPRADICPLEIPDEDPLELYPVADAVMQEEFEPCSNMFPHADGEVLNDKVVIIHSSGSAGEPEVFEPYTGVRLPSVSGDVGGRSEALWERRFLDVTTKGPMAPCHLGWGSGRSVGRHAWGACPRTPRWLGQGPRRLLLLPFDGHHHRASMALIIDDAASITVRPKPFTHR